MEVESGKRWHPYKDESRKSMIHWQVPTHVRTATTSSVSVLHPCATEVAFALPANTIVAET